ncbi:MAG: hypothetical protein OWQ51_12755 [Pyrobaculum arsenaticum]|uniref:Uncharacterized protein n=3 Tax=Pyrobaculum TaxID=2276 RepID=A4WLH0_PYRAR|nr:hypothetical protein [Pyrobaculum arsenaticum]ABP51237.1 hypothetical protein Pars_1686 [Pyrobaculum arsenaticum DSM 13514]MCY0891809.1 hypothetical protein [Pyrobaculum arsenaticum]NYR16394.1 hypothetical protein [Pyrobaculum arsenaticum]
MLFLVTQHTPSTAGNATVEGGRGDVCKLGLNITCLGGFVNASGTVWSGCEYRGEVVLNPPLPIDWGGYWGERWACLAAGRARGYYYVVLVREALAGGLSRHDPFHTDIVVRCYCEKYVKDETCRAVYPAIGYPVAVLITVNVNKSVGYVTFSIQSLVPAV